MKRSRISALVLGICLLASATLTAQSTTQRQRLEQHVYTLAADSLNGRRAGTPDAQRAAAYITPQSREMGLKPFFDNNKDYNMPFTIGREGGYCNLVAIIEGNDPVLKNEFIVIGGHYDHLGVRNGNIYNGADDNASGTACVTEVARQLLAHQGELKRSVIVCAFDAEEIGLYGSSSLAEYMEKHNLIGRVKLMMSVDMVGWLKQGGSLTLEGTGTLLNSNQLTDAKSLGIPIKINSKRFENSIFTATDTEPFAKQGVPTLAVTTGLKSPYHKPEDDADLIDYEGLDQVTGYLTDLTEDVATRDFFTSSGRVAPKHKSYSDYGVDVAVVAGYSSSRLLFPDAAFDGKTGLGWNAGLEAHLNLGNIGLRTQVLYDRYKVRYPDHSDPYQTNIRLRQDELCVPVSLVIQTKRSQSPRSSAYIGGGAYYARQLSGSVDAGRPIPMDDYATLAGLTPALNQWGWNYTAGVRMGAIQIGVMRLWQSGRFFSDTDAPKARRSSAMFQLKYIF